MSGFAFSYSRWATWSKCPASYKYKHIDKIPEPASEALAKGRKVHDVIAKFVAGASDEMPGALKRFTVMGQALHDLPKEAKAVEYQMAFDSTLRPVTWFGKNAAWRFVWDFAKIDDPRKIDAVDWKTGRKYASYDDQQQLFALPAFWLKKDLEVFEGHWLYLDNGDEDHKTFTREQVLGPSGDPAKNEGLNGVWQNNAATMAADRAFVATPSDDACKFCSFSWRKNGPCKEGV